MTNIQPKSPEEIVESFKLLYGYRGFDGEIHTATELELGILRGMLASVILWAAEEAKLDCVGDVESMDNEYRKGVLDSRSSIIKLARELCQ